MTQITADAPVTAAKPARRPRGLSAMLAFLIEKDRSYRESRKLARMDNDRLKDMGLPCNSANADFYQARGNGPADAAPIPLSGW